MGEMIPRYITKTSQERKLSLRWYLSGLWLIVF